MGTNGHMSPMAYTKQINIRGSSEVVNTTYHHSHQDCHLELECYYLTQGCQLSGEYIKQAKEHRTIIGVTNEIIATHYFVARTPLPIAQ